MSGRIAKGPLIVGSTVTLAVVDPYGVQTGQAFFTTTTDDTGHFSVQIGSAQQVEITAQGWYWCEERGTLSDAPVTLHAWASVNGPTVGDVNMMTQLTHQRVATLMSQGALLPDAITQAEAELVAELGLGGGVLPSKPGSQMDLLGGSDVGNAYDYALSLIVARSMRDSLSQFSQYEVTYQQRISALTIDFADGHFAPATLAALRQVEGEVFPGWYESAFERELIDTGLGSVVPSLDLAIDIDGDGFANASDTCPYIANPSQLPSSDIRCNPKVQYVPVPAQLSADGFSGVTDFDHDGVDDVFWFDCPASLTTHQLSVKLGTGTGHFGPVQVHPIGGSGFSSLANTLHLVDADGDGRLDILQNTQTANTLLLAVQQPDGSFAAPKNVWAPVMGPTPTTCGLPSAPDSSELKIVQTDTGPAIFNQHTGAGCKELIHPLPNGVFGTVEVVWQPPANCSAYCPNDTPESGDFNGDGHLDFAWYTSQPAPTILTRLSDGLGGYLPLIHTSVQNPPTFQSIKLRAPGDLDHDGRADLSLTYVNPSVWTPFRSNGDGTFTPMNSLWAAGWTTADLDGDGDLDVYLADPNTSHNEIYVLQGLTYVDLGPEDFNIGGGINTVLVSLPRFHRNGSDCILGYFSAPQGAANGAQGRAGFCFD